MQSDYDKLIAGLRGAEQLPLAVSKLREALEVFLLSMMACEEVKGFAPRGFRSKHLAPERDMAQRLATELEKWELGRAEDA